MHLSCECRVECIEHMLLQELCTKIQNYHLWPLNFMSLLLVHEIKRKLKREAKRHKGAEKSPIYQTDHQNVQEIHRRRTRRK